MNKWYSVHCPKCGVACEVHGATPMGSKMVCFSCEKSFSWRDLYISQGRTMGVESDYTTMALAKKSIVSTGLSVAPKLITPERLDLLTELKKRIIGQDHVLEDITSTFYRWELGLGSEEQPAGSFLLLGSTGVGKTRTVEALSEIILNDSKSLIKIDCAEFQHSHEIAKLIGSPPGYLGFRETHPALAQSRLNKGFTEKYKCSFLLFDEIEKASDALWKLLLGILDRATLTLGDNSVVDFRSTFIFMTSNLGAREMESQETAPYGFGKINYGSQAKLDSIAEQAAKKHFMPEFWNRVDTKVVYKTLSRESLNVILDQQLHLLQKRILSGLGANGFVLEVGEDCKEFLLTEGSSKIYGARELKRAIDLNLTRKLTHLIHQDPDEWSDLESVEVYMEEGKCQFRKIR